MNDLKWLFFILTVVSIPMLVIYGTGNTLNNGMEVKSNFGKFTIANLGFDSVKCAMIPFGL